MDCDACTSIKFTFTVGMGVVMEILLKIFQFFLWFILGSLQLSFLSFACILVLYSRD